MLADCVAMGRGPGHTSHLSWVACLPQPDLHSRRPRASRSPRHEVSRHSPMIGRQATDTPRLSQPGPGCRAGGQQGAPANSRGRGAESPVRDGRHVVEELPGYALQDGVPEARVVHHAPVAPVKYHHLDAVFHAGELLPIHLQTQSHTGVGRGPPPGGLPGGTEGRWPCTAPTHLTSALQHPAGGRVGAPRRHVHLGTVEVHLFGKRFSADASK